MAITGVLTADFSSFETAVKKAEVSLRGMEGGASKASTAIEGMAEGSVPPLNTLRESFGQVDQVLSASGVNIGKYARGLVEITEMSGQRQLGGGWCVDAGAVMSDGPVTAGSLTGVVGRIDWGYFAAGAINGYRVSRSADGSWSLRGTLVTFDAFKIRQRNLVFVAPHKFGEWRWPVKNIDLGEGTGPRELRATLGPQLPELKTAKGA